MKKLLPGTRPAAKQWVEHMASVLVSVGVDRDTAQPQFFNKGLQTVELHMGDMHGCGVVKDNDKLIDTLSNILKI